MNKLIMTTSMSLLALSFLSGCGGSSSGNNSSPDAVQMEQLPLEGEYKAILRPYNTPVSGWLPTGAAEIKVDTNNITVKTYLDDDAQVTHIQSLHSGSKCPTSAHDTNGDGLVDIEESQAVVGEVLVPLDADLSSQKSGEGVYPKGKSFTYQESAPLDDLMEDLYATKLNPGTPFNLEGRVILIHGTGDPQRVPTSVRSLNGLPSHLSVPIACGVLKRIR